MPATQTASRHPEICVVDHDVFGLAKKFLDRQARAVRGLWIAIRKKDFERIRKTGHDLKGSGGAYGLDGLSNLGTALEAAAGEKDGDLIEQLLASLEEKLASVELRASSPEHQDTAAKKAAGITT
ncbi:MAG: Hpt domain-containing protein [Burkholderiales bacterium]